jgi:hypothetical protein
MGSVHKIELSNIRYPFGVIKYLDYLKLNFLSWKLLGLNDRFALRRRVLSIKKKYPELIMEFKLINSKF